MTKQKTVFINKQNFFDHDEFWTRFMQPDASMFSPAPGTPSELINRKATRLTNRLNVTIDTIDALTDKYVKLTVDYQKSKDEAKRLKAESYLYAAQQIQMMFESKAA